MAQYRGNLLIYSNISFCSSSGTIKGGNFTAGITGNLYNGSTIENCFSSANITQIVVDSQQAGGLVGRLLTGHIINSYATGNVTGFFWVGGLVGNSTDNSSIDHSYSVGKVVGSSNFGGLVGAAAATTTTNSYWNTETSGQSISGSGEGKNTLQMITQATYLGWDYENVWLIENGTTYPYLTWQENPGSFNYPSVQLPPSNLTVTLGTSSANLSWDAPSMGKTPDSFNIYRQILGNENFDLLTNVTGQTTFNDESVENYTLYRYKVSAMFGASETNFTNTEVFYFFPGFAGGDGTANSPYEIENVEQLWAVRYYNRLQFKQIANIDLDVAPWNEGFGWQPIPFYGSYNGQDFSISNLHINAPSSNTVGLFSATYSAYLSNIRIENANIIGFDYASSLVGISDNSNVHNCSASGVVSGRSYTGGLIGLAYTGGSVINSQSSIAVSGLLRVGGLIGDARNVTVNNCASSGDVIGTSHSVGGLAGFAFYSNVENSNASGSVVGTNSVGGLIGGSSFSTVANSHSTGSPTGSAASIGGLIGSANSTQILYCYAEGDVLGTQFVGGLIGVTYGETTISRSYAKGNATGAIMVGGFIGSLQEYGEITESFATGNAIATNFSAGGFAGAVSSAFIANCYATGSSWAENANSAGFAGLIAYSILSNAYSLGIASSPVSQGAIGGYIENPVIENAYWNTQRSGLSESIIGSGLSNYEMLFSENFNNWDFENIWTIIEGESYPFLKWQVEPIDANITPMFQVTFNENTPNGSIMATTLGMEINSGANTILGLPVLFTATPNNGYEIVNWTVNGEIVTYDNSIYTEETLLISELMEDVSVEASFALISSINNENYSNFSVFPNPFSSSITIINGFNAKKIVITNILSQVVKVYFPSNDNNLTVETNDLPVGVYLLTAESFNGEKQVLKIVKK